MGRTAVRPDQVLDGVADVAPEIRLEVLLEEGSRLIVLREPFGPGSAEGPGAVRFADGDVPLVPERPRITLTRHQHVGATDPRVLALPVR